MYIKTKRLIIRNLVEEDAEAILEIKNDEQVMKHPFLKGDETVDFIRIMITYFRSVKEKGLVIDDQYPERGHLFAICLKDSGEVIGVITVHPSEQYNEVHMGWFMKSQYTGMGYASEAGAETSDYFLEALSLDYITALVAFDNQASFRTAQKSGFKLFEKQDEISSNCYYFRKFNKDSKTRSRFYGITE